MSALTKLGFILSFIFFIRWLVLFATFGYLYSFGVYQGTLFSHFIDSAKPDSYLTLDYYTRIYLTNHDPGDIR